MIHGRLDTPREITKHTGDQLIVARYRFLLRTRPVACLCHRVRRPPRRTAQDWEENILGAKMFDIDEAVKPGRQEQQNAAVSFLAVHGVDPARVRLSTACGRDGTIARSRSPWRRITSSSAARSSKAPIARSRPRESSRICVARHSRRGFAQLLGLAPL
jgi:hypothetical protein